MVTKHLELSDTKEQVLKSAIKESQNKMTASKTQIDSTQNSEPAGQKGDSNETGIPKETGVLIKSMSSADEITDKELASEQNEIVSLENTETQIVNQDEKEIIKPSEIDSSAKVNALSS